MTDQEVLTAIVKEYAPYETIEAFGEGFVARENGRYLNPYEGDRTLTGQVNAQAWDRGLEAAVRYHRHITGARRYKGK